MRCEGDRELDQRLEPIPSTKQTNLPLKLLLPTAELKTRCWNAMAITATRQRCGYGIRSQSDRDDPQILRGGDTKLCGRMGQRFPC